MNNEKIPIFVTCLFRASDAAKMEEHKWSPEPNLPFASCFNYIITVKVAELSTWEL